jgi:alkylhydroperoxidase/carboxymuconolactone decarboxylase family protein YurZ
MEEQFGQSRLSEEELAAFRGRYENLVGFVPPRIAARIDQLGRQDPRTLELQEELRARIMHENCLGEKSSQLMLFGMLLILLRDAALTHGIAARRAGASWEEMQATVNLAFLFGGLSAANRGAEYLAKIAEKETP